MIKDLNMDAGADTPTHADVVVVGAGPNALVAAAYLLEGILPACRAPCAPRWPVRPANF